MFSRYRVTSVSEMKSRILTFLSTVLGSNVSTSIYIVSSNRTHAYYIMQESYGISAWVVQIPDTNVTSDSTLSPYTATSTVGLCAKYIKDMQVQVVDEDATQAKIEELLEELAQEEEDEYGGSYDTTWTSARDKLEKLRKHEERVREIMATKVYKTDWERVYGTNVFHIGGTLRYDSVSTSLAWKVLDCHYNDNTFMFNLYAEDLPNYTRTLTFGELHNYHNSAEDNCFVMSNTFHLHSERKNVGYKDAFVGKDGTEAPIRGEDYDIDYGTEILKMMQVDIDYEPNPMEYSVNGNLVGLRVNLAPKHLHKFNSAKESCPLGKFAGENYKLIEWFHREIHCTYESEESNVGVNYFPLQNPGDIKSYEVYDRYTDDYKSYSGFGRRGTGGNSVNTKNNISELMPIIFYVLRDPDDFNSWSAIGQSNVVCFVNMYNMCTGRTIQSNFRDRYNRATCYILSRRRADYTPFNEDYNDTDNEWSEAWGFGGMTGIAFKDCTEGSESLLLGRGFNNA